MTYLGKLEQILAEKYGFRGNSFMHEADEAIWKVERDALQQKINEMKAAERYGVQYEQSAAASRAQRIARGEVCLELWIKP